MTRVSDVIKVIDRLAPFRSAYAGDPVGLQVGDPNAEVTCTVVSLDRSTGAIRRCIERGAQLLVCHHPLIFRPLSSVTANRVDGKAVLELASHGVAFVAAHTNWDCAKGGVNDELARMLGLQRVEAFGDSGPSNETKLVFFVPADNADRVIDALSVAGAGQIGNYRRCAFLSLGKGTFEPEAGANPHIGEVGKREVVEEARVEMVLPNSRLWQVVAALKEAHPYEEPAFDLIPLADSKPWPIGRIGLLAEPLSLTGLVRLADEALDTRSTAWGDPARPIARVAVCGGSGADLWRAAKDAGADALVTGECPQHVALDAFDNGFAIVASGHFATENPGAKALCARLSGEFPQVRWEFYEPLPGQDGRPLFV